MAVIVLLLSIMPCRDAAYSVQTQQEGKAVISQQQIPSEHSDSDDCTPFCICNCCAGFTYHNYLFSTDAVFIPFGQPTAWHIAADITEISLPVWQPPQLS